MDARKVLLIIDDDVILIRALTRFFSHRGYQVHSATDGPSGLAETYNSRPDIIILDIMMPRMDGWEVCRRIREVTDTPVIILSAKGQEDDRVHGLNMGADDYVLKPFSLRELEARVRTILRRCHEQTPRRREQTSLIVGDDLVIDPKRWEVRRDGQAIELTPTEMRFLLYLAQNANRVVTHSELLTNVWGEEYVSQTDYTKLLVWRLRRKIEENPSQPHRILTERGLGYRFTADT